MASAGKLTDAGGLVTLYVGDLHPDVTEMHLHEKFQVCGPIAMIHVCRDSATHKSLGYAYVNYCSHVDAVKAMDKLNYCDIKGRCCRIMWSNRERQMRASTEANIFVKNLDATIDTRALYETFSIFGHIISCKVAADMSGVSRGYGFVQYESEDAAKQAIERVNGMLIGGKKVFVGPFLKRDHRDQPAEGSDCSVYVRNIPSDWEDDKVNEVFAVHGEVVSSLLLNDGNSGRRYGFVNFKDAAAAAAAIETLHGKDLRTEEEKAAMEAKDAEKQKTSEEGRKTDAPLLPDLTVETKLVFDGTSTGARGNQDSADPAVTGDDKESKDAKDKDGGSVPERLPSYCLCVSRSKTKAEREAEMKERRATRQERFEGIKLYVRHLPADMTDDGLRELFTEFGTVTDVKAVLDRDTGACKGFGFVRYATTEEAAAAVQEMHLKEAIPGQPPLYVGLAGQAGAREDRWDGGIKREGKGGKGHWGKGGGKGSKDRRWANMHPHAGMYSPMGPLGMPVDKRSMPSMGMGPIPRMPGNGPMQGMCMQELLRTGDIPWAGDRPYPPVPQFRVMQNGMVLPGMPGMPGMPTQYGGPRPPPANQTPPSFPKLVPHGPASTGAGSAGASTGAQGGQLTAATLAHAPGPMRKQMLGEKLFPMVARHERELAGKITGMLLEMDDGELLMLLESEATLQQKVAEAVRVLCRPPL